MAEFTGLSHDAAAALLETVPEKGGPRSRRVAVVGVGVSGLVAIKELQDLGHTVVAFEHDSSMGGIYKTHYDSLTMTSSSATTRLGSRSDVDDSNPRFWTRHQYLGYLRNYSERYGLHACIRFGCNVVGLERIGADARWLVRWHEKGRETGEEAEEFDAVALCCGVHAKAKIPDIRGMDRFPGIVQHSSMFSGNEDLSTETVLIIGLGESGSDIALMTSTTARKVILSTRRGPGYVIPRIFGGIPSDVDTSRAYHSFPVMHYAHPVLRLKRLLDKIYLSPRDDRAVMSYVATVNARRGLSGFQRFGTKNASFVESVLYHGAVEKPAVMELEGKLVRFTDGSEAIVDRVVFCTGYIPSFPEIVPESGDVVAAIEPRALYKRMFMPTIGRDLTWIGLVRPGIGSIPPMVEMQARYFALVVSGLRTLPGQAAMRADIEYRERCDQLRYPEDAGVSRSLTDYLSYMDNMADLIGCRPPLLTLLLTDPFIWYKVMFGPISGLQYRLIGPGADPVYTFAALRATRTVGVPIIVYEAIVLLLCVPLRLLRACLHTP